jgi:hypothetical protein
MIKSWGYDSYRRVSQVAGEQLTVKAVTVVDGDQAGCAPSDAASIVWSTGGASTSTGSSNPVITIVMSAVPDRAPNALASIA